MSMVVGLMIGMTNSQTVFTIINLARSLDLPQIVIFENDFSAMLQMVFFISLFFQVKTHP